MNSTKIKIQNISRVENKIIKLILYSTHEIINTCFAQIYTFSDSTNWLYSNLEGALVLAIDLKNYVAKFLLFDLKTFNITFECELFKSFSEYYKKGSDRFYYFEINKGFIGFFIPDVKEADVLNSYVFNMTFSLIKNKIKNFKKMKDEDFVKKSSENINILKEKICKDKNNYRMIQNSLNFSYRKLDKIINTVKFENNEYFLVGTNFNGLDEKIKKLNGIKIVLQNGVKIGNKKIFCNQMAKNLLNSYLRNIIIPKRKINRDIEIFKGLNNVNVDEEENNIDENNKNVNEDENNNNINNENNSEDNKNNDNENINEDNNNNNNNNNKINENNEINNINSKEENSNSIVNNNNTDNNNNNNNNDNNKNTSIPQPPPILSNNNNDNNKNTSIPQPPPILLNNNNNSTSTSIPKPPPLPSNENNNKNNISVPIPQNNNNNGSSSIPIPPPISNMPKINLSDNINNDNNNNNNEPFDLTKELEKNKNKLKKVNIKEYKSPALRKEGEEIPNNDDNGGDSMKNQIMKAMMNRGTNKNNNNKNDNKNNNNDNKNNNNDDNDNKNNDEKNNNNNNKNDNKNDNNDDKNKNNNNNDNNKNNNDNNNKNNNKLKRANPINDNKLKSLFGDIDSSKNNNKNNNNNNSNNTNNNNSNNTINNNNNNNSNNTINNNNNSNNTINNNNSIPIPPPILNPVPVVSAPTGGNIPVPPPLIINNNIAPLNNTSNNEVKTSPPQKELSLEEQLKLVSLKKVKVEEKFGLEYKKKMEAEQKTNENNNNNGGGNFMAQLRNVKLKKVGK